MSRQLSVFSRELPEPWASDWGEDDYDLRTAILNLRSIGCRR